jgi:tetratricopeptide (TPR) repeat protein
MRTMLRIAGIAIAVWLSGYADAQAPPAVPQYTTIVPDADAASSSISPEDARAILKNAAGYLCIRCSLTRGPRKITGIDVIEDQVLVFIQANGDRNETLPVSALAVRESILDDHGKVLFTAAADNQVVLLDISADLATKVADALAVIKLAPALKEQQIAFETQAKSYRDAVLKPVPGEEVRRYRVQAEAAVSDRRYQDAADLYTKALYTAPWWPEGHFNAALICGELHQYAKAIDHMQKYLALVPSAPDARAAQDKIYVWESERPLGHPLDLTRTSLVR